MTTTSSLLRSFCACSALVGALLTTPATVHATPPPSFTVFSAPYATGLLSSSFASLPDPTVTGAWTWDILAGGSSSSIKAPSASSLEFVTGTYMGTSTVDFKTTIVAGYEKISFDYNAVINYGTGNISWFKNGTFNPITGAGTVTDEIFTAGDTFGFRLDVTDSIGQIAARDLTLSNLTATASSIPEPASVGTWIGLGVVGLIAMREMRRRRSASAPAQS
jgi:hypothetical protein